ncbi:LLM class flavin-dependent oxidoreductase [Novosphingobium profundi]|uniref:LLM class flavin-dependent oxidoreductase n=1 Tax=Novosphingobium profundi TaxID=1774954 RepID=UPI001BDA2E97|nr:LLM class flavin-dependent oxidoreductase [Novosphingobium profundi]MBT0671727.1 LLM class flavin-dependent oxidoreductase [Novosphingobium profundi]
MIEFFGILHWNDYSETHPTPFDEVDPDFIAACARAHEEAGFARVLIANSAHRPDSLPIATWAAAATRTLGFMLAHRPGFVAPTMAARMFAILDRMSGGRCAVHIITGGDDGEVKADGDYTTKDERYRRSHEYVEVLRKTWSSAEPFDHAGEFYRIEGGFAHVRPSSPGLIPIFWGGSSPASLEYGARVADVYAFPGFAAEALREPAREVLSRARGLGRTMELLTSLRVLCAETEAMAWERAHALQDQLITEVVDNGRFPALPGEPRSRTLARAKAQCTQGALVGRLWAGITRVPTGRPALGCLVGSHDQVAEALAQYHALGFGKFIVSGYDPIADARLFGAELFDRTRARCTAHVA